MRRVGDFVKAMLRAERSYFVGLRHEGLRLLDRFGVDNVPGAIFQISRPILSLAAAWPSGRATDVSTCLQPFILDKAAPASAAEDIFRNFLFFIGLLSFVHVAPKERAGILHCFASRLGLNFR